MPLLASSTAIPAEVVAWVCEGGVRVACVGQRGGIQQNKAHITCTAADMPLSDLRSRQIESSRCIEVSCTPRCNHKRPTTLHTQGQRQAKSRGHGGGCLAALAEQPAAGAGTLHSAGAAGGGRRSRRRLLRWGKLERKKGMPCIPFQDTHTHTLNSRPTAAAPAAVVVPAPGRNGAAGRGGSAGGSRADETDEPLHGHQRRHAHRAGDGPHGGEKDVCVLIRAGGLGWMLQVGGRVVCSCR